MIRKCFNEEVKASNKNWKVNGSAVCFLYNIFFLCYFYSRSLYCFSQLFSSGKSGWLWKELVAQLLGVCEKNRLLNGVENSLACQRHCSNWSVWTQASSLVRHWSITSSTTLCWYHISTSCCRNSSFCISLGSAVTFFWSGKICSQQVSSFLRNLCIKNYWNRFIFDRVIPKITRSSAVARCFVSV